MNDRSGGDEGKKKKPSTYDIDQHIQGICLPVPCLDEFRSIMFRPLGLVLLAEIAAKGLFAPVALTGVGDRGEGGDGFVFVRVFEELWCY